MHMHWAGFFGDYVHASAQIIERIKSDIEPRRFLFHMGANPHW